MITIAILSTLYQGLYDPKTTKSIINAVNELPYRFVNITTNNMSPYVHLGRRKVMHAALNYPKQIDHCLWLDSDVWFTPEDLNMLIEDNTEKGCDLVTGIYYARQPNHAPLIATGSDYYGYKFDNDFPRILHKVENGVCGLGFCMVSSAALRHYATEYQAIDWFDSSRFFPGCAPADDRWSVVGEDLDFCEKMRYIGYPLYVDGRVRVSHRGITQADWEEARNTPGAEYCPISVTELEK